MLTYATGGSSASGLIKTLCLLPRELFLAEFHIISAFFLAEFLFAFFYGVP
jgi:hypothetical protein